MRNWIIVITLILFFILSSWYIWSNNKQQQPERTPTQQLQTSMTLIITSPAFKMNQNIPARFTCDGEDISPELIFEGVPEGTKSLALVVDDPDAPRGVWTHWTAWNIPPATSGVKENAVPGTEGLNSSGEIGYEGPCPPDREHRYVFTLYALDSLLSLPQGSTKEELLLALTPHIIEKTQLIGRYNRN